MAIDSNEKKLSLLDWDCEPGPIPLGGDGIDQGDKQHFLGSYSGIVWGVGGVAKMKASKMMALYAAQMMDDIENRRQ